MTRQAWMDIAGDDDMERIKGCILTAYIQGAPWKAGQPKGIEVAASYNRILDFGCGLGRNFSYLRTIGK